MKIRWTLFLNRPGVPIIIASLMFPAYCFSLLKKKTGLNVGNNYIKLDAQGNLYFDKRELKISGKRLLRFITENPIETERLIKKCFREGDSFIKFANKVFFRKPEHLNKKEFLKIWQDFRKRAKDFAFWMVFPQTVDKYLEDYLRKRVIQPKIEKYNLKIREDNALSIIINPQKKILAQKEYEDLLKFTLWLKKNKLSLKNSKAQAKIKKHLFLYSWIKARWWRGKGITLNELTKIIEKQFPKVELLLKEVEEKKKLAKREFNSLLKQFKFSEKEKLLIKTTKEIVFVRTYRTDVLNLVGCRFRRFFEFLAKEFNLTYEDFIYLTADEIEETIKEWKISPELRKEIKKRKNKTFVYYAINGKEKVICKTRSKDKKIVTKEIKGRVAYPGQLKGNVKLVLNKTQLSKIKGGEILVTKMTTPDFIAVLKRVRAIITDEGGITCHAAIISRELNKPCIIGTKIATQALKDGDLVEVDANKGFVKILKK